jgi:hypothetical protein
MPEKVEKDLRRLARKKGLTGKRFKAYVYGGLRRTGWRPSFERKSG